MRQPFKQSLLGILVLVLVISTRIGLASTQEDSPVAEPVDQHVAAAEQSSSAETPPPSERDPAIFQTEYPLRNYLFIHDTSLNMRRKRRIPMMQDSMRSVLNQIPLTANVGLRAFGHRFPTDGPDACSDTDTLVPINRLNRNREDIETQLNLLTYPPLGGGAPVGLALEEGIADLEPFQGHKEIFLYLVDLQKCPDEQPLAIIESACEVEDLHLTLIGIGLKRDMKTLERANVQQLGCVDLINVLTPEEGEALSDRLLTRLSLEFRNAEGELVDPAPGDALIFELSRRTEDGQIETTHQKIKTAQVKGSTLETVGLEEDTYYLRLSYEGQNIRNRKEIVVTAQDESREVIQLGRMVVDVTDSLGNLVDDPAEREVKITLTDSGNVIRTVTDTAQTTFDVLPGKRYQVHVSYQTGGKLQRIKYDDPIEIQEGNHKEISVALPIGAISGRILTMEGRPASDVNLVLSPDDAYAATIFERTLTTDENGRYFAPDVSAGMYTLTLNQDGYKPETRKIQVVGGTINTIEDISLFHGIEIAVTGISGKVIDDADIALIHKDSGTPIATTRYQDVYRNIHDIASGTYLLTVDRAGYQSFSQEVLLEDDMPLREVAIALPYYITVRGKIVNGKGEAVPDAEVAFHQTHSTPQSPDASEPIAMSSDGMLEATLLVTGQGEETLDISWTDLYNQSYHQQVTFPLPGVPQELDLQDIRLPINFLRFTLEDVMGKTVAADTIVVYHKQSGQSGIQMNEVQTGIYESTALQDGDYSIRIIKRGYQEIEQPVRIAGGTLKHIPFTLYNYITVAGTVTHGKGDRVEGASIAFQGDHSSLASLQPIVTGRDGRFQATLLVKQAHQEKMTIRWKSPDSGKEYQIQTLFDLPGIPIAKFYPLELGNYQLPANFVQVKVQDVFQKGLSEAQVTFIANDGESTPGVELGDGVYESLDLHDGYYNIIITKPGYKENTVISDVAVGKGQREVTLGPIELPHYATITGTVLNGKDAGVPNVEIVFGGNASEQLERCITDQQGRFSTTLLVTNSGQERWQARWQRDEFRTSGQFPLPMHPQKSANLGEIRLPANFVSIPVEDIRGKILEQVQIDITYKNGKPVTLDEFSLEEMTPGIYQAGNLPDGTYSVLLHKAGYERNKSFDLTVRGGTYYRLDPVQLGYYVTLTGTTINGKRAPVPDVMIRVQETCSTFLGSDTPRSDLPPAPETTAEEHAAPDTPSTPEIVTNADGRFSARLLVTSPGIEEITATWGEQYRSSFQVNVSNGPETQDITLHLPINFIQIQLTDISRQAISDASLTATHQIERTTFPLHEREPGLYESPGLPDGNYVLTISKDRYESQTDTITVNQGEVHQTALHLKHYVTVKGYVTNGKQEGVSAATVSFGNLKTVASAKILSGTDGAFETELLMKDTGRESATITWVGRHDTYTKQFWIDLPDRPTQIEIPADDTRLPINYISIEVKSVAATGVPDATVLLTHSETGKVIEAQDNGNGNYEGQELPDGSYTIMVAKEKYQTMILDNVVVADGIHKSGILVPKFPHYITISGFIFNGKEQGVPNATVAVKDPQRLQDCAPFTTRDDGSFTLRALVTDVGTETLEVVWNEIYSTSIPVKLPFIPEHIRLDPVKLPINFIVVKVLDIYDRNLSNVTISFLKKDAEETPALQIDSETSTAMYQGREISPGIYESPELPDNEYLILARKEGYIQNIYPEVFVQDGMTVSDVTLSLPHLVTLQGQVTNGKGEGVPDVQVIFGEENSLKSTEYLETNASGTFVEQLQVTGQGKETIRLLKTGHTDLPSDHFEYVQEFTLAKQPGEQHFDVLRLPMNFIPLLVKDVAGNPIDDAEIALIPLDEASSTRSAPSTTDADDSRFISRALIEHVGDGRYEGQNIKDGTYKIVISKQGYKPQEQTISVAAGEVAPESVFILPHYILVKGIVTEGKGNGVPDAVLEFDTQNSDLVALDEIQQDQPTITTDLNGQFLAKLLVKKSGRQQVRAIWNSTYVKQFSFPLPEHPNMNYLLDEEIRLPINFVPFQITNVLGQGLAGVDIRLQKSGENGGQELLASPLGGGYYEARELLDGVYTVTIQKDGYQDVTSTLAVHGGEQAPEQQVSLPHYVTVRGTVVNGKGQGMGGAEIALSGLNSRLLASEQPILTAADGSFQLDVLVTGSDSQDLQEHIEIAWEDPSAASAAESSSTQEIPFGISYDFSLPPVPGNENLGLLRLPVNFYTVAVQDVSGKGLPGVHVKFIDDTGREFIAKESVGGFYEGQHLPNGTYTLHVAKDGYRADQKPGIVIPDTVPTTSATSRNPLTFQLPYYITIEGTTIDGKGQELTSDIALELEGTHSQLIPGTVNFDQHGKFTATLLVNSPGREHLHITWKGKHGLHVRQIPFVLPEAPETVDLQRIALPVNFVPIEVNDLLGYGVTGATVTLYHIDTDTEIPARDKGNGRYEGEYLLDGTYKIAISKEGYKSVDNALVRVANGIVSTTQSFRLPHYVWVTGVATNGEGEGIRDPLIEFDHLRSHDTSKRTDITGTFEVQLEVQEVGTERMYISWKNAYTAPV
ncbi:hypothetical protein GF339_23330, partial [candidate division KSB3 bacterium]|nr:hypothetical protein [candidate division KSB3 bacterium]MBD3327537.1 hypothetical protein [candidate division KSB3 bacterium]